ncbi:hypothetical protein SAMN05216317_10346 [Nitrosomonas eutropha]|nr:MULTISPECIES: hypothetical protein [Nitrosomonas]SDW20899.1 hypothetical protein SAMN05216317_10346 [Nitrosomonas eutropha]
MITIWENLSINIKRLFIAPVVVTSVVLIGMQLHVNTWGSGGNLPKRLIN